MKGGRGGAISCDPPVRSGVIKDSMGRLQGSDHMVQICCTGTQIAYWDI